MTSDDLGTALRDRVADVTPDLDSILAGAVRRGRRIRAVRRSGVALGTAAAVAAVSLGVASMTGGTATTPQYADGGDSPSVSPSPTTSPTPATNADGLYVGERIALPGPSGAHGTVRMRDGQMAFVTRTASSDDMEYVAAHYPHTPFLWSFSEPDAASAPLTVSAKGWICQVFAPDGKVQCSKGGAIASVNWRPADEHSGFLDPAKADIPGDYAHTWVGDVHGAWFATIQPMTSKSTTTPADIDELAAGLTWN